MHTETQTKSEEEYVEALRLIQRDINCLVENVPLKI
jgi:hypothetical protein